MTAENAVHAIHLILRHEGGYVNNKHDPGGPTNMGVTIATFRKFVKPNGSVDDLKALTKEQAVIVYKRQYWDVVLGDFLPSGLDYALTDFKVMSGAAVRILQGIVKVEPDGIVGPATLEAIARWDTRNLIDRLGRERLGYYQSLSAWPHFKNGWTRRVNECTATALEWAENDLDGAPIPKTQSWLKRLIGTLKEWRPAHRKTT